MKRPQITSQTIGEVADGVTRQSNEPESIDLAADATDSAPAKSLLPDRRPKDMRTAKSSSKSRASQTRPS